MSSITGVEAPDGGWGWVIVGFGMFAPSLYACATRCLSVFYDPLMAEYQVNYSQVAWLNGLHQAGHGVSSFVLPVLYKYIGFRVGVMAAGMVSAIFVFLASYVHQLVLVQICCGLIPGLCSAVINLGLFTTVNRYFKHKRNMAMQITCTGTALGAFVYCPLNQYLIDSYGWKGSLQILSGLYLNVMVVGALLRPIVLKSDVTTNHLAEPETRNDETSNTSSGQTTRATCTAWCRLWDLQVFLNIGFHTLNLSWITFAAAYYSSLTYLVTYGRTVIGLSGTAAAGLVSAVSLGELGSRLLFGSFFDRFSQSNRIKIVAGIELLMAALFISIPFFDNIIPVLVLCGGIGAIGGGMDAVFAVLIVDTFGLKGFQAVYSYSNVVCSITGSCVTILIGLVIDTTGNSKVVFYIGASSLLLSIIFILLLDKINQRQERNIKHPVCEEISNSKNT
ncbi:monocarboxylate transporter 12 isoform X1 [Ciona intestinalis]